MSVGWRLVLLLVLIARRVLSVLCTIRISLRSERFLCYKLSHEVVIIKSPEFTLTVAGLVEWREIELRVERGLIL